MPRFILFGEAHAQTDQDIAKMNELAHYMNVLAAFTDACTNAISDPSTSAICTQIENQEHDTLKPFMDANNNTMARVIVGGH
jgi:hypothetical protein